MRIVIPAAGDGRRFAEAGYPPKPLIDVAGKSMIQRVIECLLVGDHDTVTLISRLPIALPGVAVVRLTEPTQGAADTLLAVDWDDGPFMVANCDQLVTAALVRDFADFANSAAQWDAAVMTFNSTNPHHSYVRTTRQRAVTEIAEKRVISDQAVLGVYWFRSGTLLAEYATKTVATAEKVNGEFYVSSILALMIADSLRIGAFEVDVADKHMLGTPEELQIFLDKVRDGRVVL